MLRVAVIALIVGGLAAARLAGITPDIGQAEDKPLAEQVKAWRLRNSLADTRGLRSR
jgi:hypothetical protein